MEIVRVPNCVLSGLGAVFSILVYTGYTIYYDYLIVGFLTGFLITASSMIVNDIVDIEVDKLNKPWKPIPRGDITQRKAWMLAVFTLSLALLLNYLLGIKALTIASIYTIIGLSYNFLRKQWWSHFLVALSTTGPIVYGYVVAGAPRNDLPFTIVFTVIIVLVTLGREFMKAIQDIEGDRKQGYATVATILSEEEASKVMLLTGVMGSAIGLYSITMETSTAYKVLITIAAVFYATSIIIAHRNNNKLEKSRKNTLIAMYIGMIAFWLSKTPF